MSLDRRGFLGRLTAVVAAFSASPAAAVALPAAPAPAKGGLVSRPPEPSPTPPPAKTALGHVAGGGGYRVSDHGQSTMKMVTDLLADCAVVSMSRLTFGVGELAKMEVVYAYDPDEKLRRQDSQLQADVAAMLTPRSGITSVSVESVCDSVDIDFGPKRRTHTKVTDYRIVVEWIVR